MKRERIKLNIEKTEVTMLGKGRTCEWVVTLEDGTTLRIELQRGDYARAAAKTGRQEATR